MRGINKYFRGICIIKGLCVVKMGRLNVNCGSILNNLDNKDLIVNSANRYMSVGCGINDYKHIDVAKDVVIRLKELVSEYDIDFMLVLPSEEIEEICSIYNSKGL